jgi:murein DD-endopeptidase MepM/ murein hydrolase activator NlpD
LREQVEEASAEEADVLDRLDDVAARKRNLDSQVRALDGDIAATEASLAAATEQLAIASADLTRAEAKFSATIDGLASARTELVDRAVSAYIHQPASEAASALLDRQNFREVAATRDFLRSVVEAQARTVERYRVMRDEIDRERQTLAGARQEFSSQRDLVDQHRTELLDVRTRQASLRTQAATEEGRQKVLLAEVRTRVKDFEAQIAALKKESDSIASLLRSRQSGQKLLPSGKGVLDVPVPGGITSGFGVRVHPIFGTKRMHTGVDFSGSSGTPIRAAAEGVVVVAAERGGYGNAVIIDHGNALATLYAHQSRMAVGEGAKVTRGQVIGYVGSTGFATGPHLHFEVRVNGNPVDPLRYL